MVTRRLIKNGFSSLTLSVPINWARKLNLKEKDEVNIEENGPILIISKGKSKTPQRKEIRKKKGTPFIKRVFITPYILGFNELYVKFEDPKDYNKIIPLLYYLPGFDIVESRKDSCLIKLVQPEIEANFDKPYKDILRNINEQFEMIEKYTKGEAPDLEYYDLLQENIIRNMILARRILNTKGLSNFKQITSKFKILHTFEELGAYGYIFLKNCKINTNLKKVMPEVLRLFKQYTKYIETMDSHLDPNSYILVDLAVELHESNQMLRKKLNLSNPEELMTLILIKKMHNITTN